MISDPIADMLATIKNGYLAKKDKVMIPYSKIKEEIAKTLIKSEYLLGIKKEPEKKLNCELKYNKGKPAIRKIIRISKPGRRIYVKSQQLPVVLGGLGTAIISTSEGIMTSQEAKKKKLGGEVICQVW